MNGKRVYIHCRAGHGRSSAVVIAWLIHKNPFVDLKVLNDELLKVRTVRTYLWTQPNIRKFQDWVRSSSSAVNDDGGVLNIDSATKWSPVDDDENEATLATTLSSFDDLSSSSDGEL